MKTINGVAMVVGYCVAVLYLLGTLGLGEFMLRFGPPARADGKTYTCRAGDGFWSRRKYACDFREYIATESAAESAAEIGRQP